MKNGILVLAVFLTIAPALAAEINLTEISNEIDFFGAKAGFLNEENNSNDMIFFGFFGGGFIAIMVIIAFVGIVFYKYKYSRKGSGAVGEQDMFNKYNY
ncbi:MAG: hypothetical protein GON13_01765 [Nanoarchaeota archaeon]|nr:hypothetical protein [Nanoarchaeota archaeon]